MVSEGIRIINWIGLEIGCNEQKVDVENRYFSTIIRNYFRPRRVIITSQPHDSAPRILKFHPVSDECPIGSSGIVKPQKLHPIQMLEYRISICLPQGKHKLQLDRASGTGHLLFSLFFFFHGHRYRSRHEIKETSPKGPVWIRFQGRFAERMTSVSRGICGPSRFILHPSLKAIMSTESVVACGKGIHRVPVGRSV